MKVIYIKGMRNKFYIKLGPNAYISRLIQANNEVERTTSSGKLNLPLFFTGPQAAYKSKINNRPFFKIVNIKFYELPTL